MISLIAALGRNRVIGAGNRMPWHLPDDLKYFKRVTNGRPIVMGRKTYESIGKLLPGRENRIVSRREGYAVEGARVFLSLREACEAEGEIFVIGGAEIYELALEFADRLYLTEIDFEFVGDTFFPELPDGRFREKSRERLAPDPENGRKYGLSFVVLDRVAER